MLRTEAAPADVMLGGSLSRPGELSTNIPGIFKIPGMLQKGEICAIISMEV